MITYVYMKGILVSALIDSQRRYSSPKFKELALHSSTAYWNTREYLYMGELGIMAYDLDVHLLLKAMWYSIQLHINFLL